MNRKGEIKYEFTGVNETSTVNAKGYDESKK